MAFITESVGDPTQQVHVIADDFVSGVGLFFQLTEAVVFKACDALVGVVDPVFTAEVVVKGVNAVVYRVFNDNRLAVVVIGVAGG